MTTLYAWAEQGAGRPDAWAAAQTLEHYSDIPAAFAAALEQGADTAAATRAAFTAWYASDWRRERYYLSACGHYLDLLDDAHAIERHDPLPADYFSALCRMPDGTGYDCQSTDEIRSSKRTAD